MGNDIVDLKAPGAMGKAGNARFVRRILTIEEQQAVLCADHPDALLWILWAAKEAAYKAVSKSHPDVSFSPGRYSVKLKNEKPGVLGGMVKTPGGIVRIRIFSHEDYVHCIGITASHSGLDRIVYGIKAISREEKMNHPPACQSMAARKLAKERIASYTGRDQDDIQIIRNNTARGQGPPMVYFKGKKDNIDISLSHDGRFVAYAFVAA